MATQILITIVSIVYLFLIAIFISIDKKKNKDTFSPIKTASYFSAIEAIAMLWVSLSPNMLEEIIFSGISQKYHQDDLVIFAYITSIIIYLFVILGVLLGSYSKDGSPRVIESLTKISFCDLFARPAAAAFLYISGVIIYLYFLGQIGGLSNLWQNIWLRTSLSAGLGYYQASYTSLILISTALIYPSLQIKKKWLSLTVIVSTSIFILASLGQRAPAATLIFILLLTHHYKVNRIRNPINIKTCTIALLLISFMFVFVNLRESEQSQKNRNFERSVIQRLATIERQIVTLGYFSENPFWYQNLYVSLLYAPIPRTLYDEKPPVDTGVYLNTIRQGININPPLPAKSIDASSWPDGFLAGYISLGFPGLIIVCLASGYLYGTLYRLAALLKYSTASVILYAYAGFMGVTALSPLGIVIVLSMIIPFSILGWISILFLSRTHKAPSVKPKIRPRSFRWSRGQR